ncbi:MAG: hypothetical protein HBSAPP03_10950 [Phycisphaerae bacterium]|nr:MAG: hypothetical protein HBSAPP03_10950 [Phycisphaerae bacterium]
MRLTTLIIAFAAMAPVLGQPVPDYGLDWRTIGDPGNVAAQPADYFWLQVMEFGPVGRVDYEFRMNQFEMTNGRWVEFVDSYTRANPAANVSDLSLTGLSVRRSSDDPQNYGWYAIPGTENVAVEIGWFSAARYANWLHNGKVTASWAFETGAYDMSSFYQLPGGLWEGNSQHLPGALFWLPSWDEWTKSMHWDPNKSGPGQGGYWLYPHSSDSRPVTGLPGEPGAQTSGGLWPNVQYPIPVGSYPNSQSPWGLLDGSGGSSEYLGYWVDGVPDTRGSNRGLSPSHWDRLDYLGTTGFPDLPMATFRLASVVPSPVTLIVLVLIPFRRRRTCVE